MAKKNYTEIEKIIEKRIAELEEEYELDNDDIEEIRTEAYKENGWNYDPFPLEEEEEPEEEEIFYGYRSLEDQLWEVGMSMEGISFKGNPPQKRGKAAPPPMRAVSLVCVCYIVPDPVENFVYFMQPNVLDNIPF